MLNIYRRHSPKCPHYSEGRQYNRCRCRIWYDWNLDARRITKPIGTRDWQKAQQLAREIEAEGRVVTRGSPLIETACEDFLADAKARQLQPPSIYKYELLLRRLQAFAKDKGLVYISNFTVEMTAKFRETWTNKGTSARKKLEQLRTFFRFCHDRKWISENPAKKLKMGRDTEPPKEPFPKSEVTAILNAVPAYAAQKNAKQNAVRLRALVLLLRYSGLRLGDAVTLERNRIERGRLFLRTAKTGTRVFVPLPKTVTDAINECPGRQYPFWSGMSKRKSVIGNWQRALKRLFKLANIPTGHAHRFRHTFACELLMAGTPLTDVAQLLGHSSEKTTEKHYGAWVRGRQERLEAAVRGAWSSDFDLTSVTTALQSRKRHLQPHEK